MCKMSDNIAKAIKYYYQLTGEKLVVKEATPETTRKLPILITKAYTFYVTELTGIHAILLDVKNPYDATPIKLQKHQNIISAKTGSHTIFILERIASYNISRLAAAKVNFIVPNKQIYIPSLMMNMKEVKSELVLEDEVMPSMAQCILLYHLEKCDLTGKTAKELADMFKVSYPNTSRAMRWLEKKGLCRLEGVKTKELILDSDRKTLWREALPLMPSPIERVAYTSEPFPEAKIAGESAMEKLTMLASPQIPSIAISKASAKKQGSKLFKHESYCRVEIWRYDPNILATGNTVDPLSLYLSLQKSNDERVQIELDNLTDFIG